VVAFFAIMVLSFPPKDEAYIAYIDESGDPGIRNPRLFAKGPVSEWFSMGAIVVQLHREPEIVQWVKEIHTATRVRRRDLHFAHMNDVQRKIACASIAQKPVRCFALVSNKKNMIGYRNVRAEAARGGSANETFYNFCARILLERVTDFVLEHSLKTYQKPKHVHVIFSNRGGTRYSQTKAYFDLLMNQARSRSTVLNAREIKWEVMHPQLIDAELHENSAGLQLADSVASAFCYAADAHGPRVHNSSHAESLKRIIWHKDGVYAKNGVTLLPWNPALAKLTEQQKKIFRFYGYRI
jgi:Protein of unknown function (DUF3800)